MSDWKDQLKEAYAVIRDKKKAAKPQNKSAFDSEVNYKGRAGFNDSGIPLSPGTIKNKQKNRSAYAARARAKYYAAGSQLRNINEQRKIDAQNRWAVKVDKPVTEFKTTAPASRSFRPFAGPTYKRSYNYYDPIQFDDSVEVTPSTSGKYTIDNEPQFKNKIEEEIYRLKKKKY